MPDQEPDNYSLDEMMDRLKSRGRSSSSDGEAKLVTRPDGTQVMKVRRRKRRTRQPHKEAEMRRRRRSLIMVSVITLVLITGGLAFFGWVFYLNSGGYREKVVARMEKWTGADLKLTAFRATPVSVGADLVEMEWPADCPAAFLRVHQPRADLKFTSHLTGTWAGERLAGTSGEMVLRHSGASNEIPPAEGTLPFQVPVQINKFKLLFGEGERPALGVYDAVATLNVADPAQPEPNIVLQGGITRIGGWGRYTVNFASVLLGDEGVRLGRLRLSPEGLAEAEFEAFGEGFGPVPVRGGFSEYGFRVHAMPSEALFGEKLGELIEGTFETTQDDLSGRLFLDVTKLDSIRIDARVRGARDSAMKFYRFPMFEVIGDVLDTARFVQPVFDPESSLRLIRTADDVALEELEFIAEDMLRLRGKLREVRGGGLSGEIQVGIADAYLELAEAKAVGQVFDRAADGYRWATVTLSGTTSRPADDLADQLRAAMESVPAAARGDVGNEEEFFNLTTPDE